MKAGVLKYKIADFRVAIEYSDEAAHDALCTSSLSPFATDDTSGKDDIVFSVLPDESEIIADSDYVDTFTGVDDKFSLYKRRKDESPVIVSEGNPNEGFFIGADKDLLKFSICIKADKDFYQPELVRALMIAFTFATSSADTMMIHSSTLTYKGKAFLFLGKSGTGKSTHSQCWLRNVEGAELLNDDNPILRIVDGKWFAYGSPWSGKTPCYRDASAPVGAFVSLEQYPENAISRLDKVQAFISLFTSVSTLLFWRPAYDNILDSLTRLSTEVPVFLLKCLPDDAAALLCRDTVCDDNIR